MDSKRGGEAKEYAIFISRSGEATYEYEVDDESVVLSHLKEEEDARAPTQSLDPGALATSIARALAPQLRRLLRPVGVPPDDAFVDQDAGLFDREVYLRLARRSTFPNTKVGKKRVARWADVKAAFMGAGKQVAVVEPTDDPESDLLNEIRQRAGLAVRGGR